MIPGGGVDIADGLCSGDAELMARCVRGQPSDDAADDGHRISAVGHAGAPLTRGL